MANSSGYGVCWLATAVAGTHLGLKFDGFGLQALGLSFEGLGIGYEFLLSARKDMLKRDLSSLLWFLGLSMYLSTKAPSYQPRRHKLTATPANRRAGIWVKGLGTRALGLRFRGTSRQSCW